MKRRTLGREGDPTSDDQVRELQASRARIVAAADAERRRIERALHDGAQQDLVALSVSLQLARELLESDPGTARTQLDEIRGHLRGALEDVRRLAWSIYPALLDRGLAQALMAAAHDAEASTRVDVDALGRHPPEIEAAVYFVCVEAVAAATGRAEVRAWTDADALRFEVVADGPGVVDTTDARDRLEALGGAWELARRNGGSLLSGRYPCSAR
jgi:signal transduction histidine kinase